MTTQFDVQIWTCLRGKVVLLLIIIPVQAIFQGICVYDHPCYTLINATEALILKVLCISGRQDRRMHLRTNLHKIECASEPPERHPKQIPSRILGVSGSVVLG